MKISLMISKHTLLAAVALFAILNLKLLPSRDYFLMITLLTLILIYSIRFKISELKPLLIAVPILFSFSLIFGNTPGNTVVWKSFRNENTLLKLSSGKTVSTSNDNIRIGDIVDENGDLISKGNPILNLLPRLRFKIYTLCSENLPYPVSEIVSAMTLGVRENLPISVKTYMVLNGTYHYLAISGLHIGVIVSVLYLIFKLLKSKNPFLKSSITSGVFLPLTGFPPSAVRAFLFTTIVSIGKTKGRKVDLIYITILIAILFAVLSKISTGAILSFLAVIGIIAAINYEKLKTPLIFILPFLFTLPFITTKFGTFNLLSPINSILLLPIVYITLLLSLLSEATLFSIPQINKILFLSAKTLILTSKLQYKLTKAFVIHSKIPESIVISIYILVFLFLSFERIKTSIAILLIFTALATLIRENYEGKHIFLRGENLNSFYFLTGTGQKYRNCVISSNYVFPFSRKVLSGNRLIDLRVNDLLSQKMKAVTKQDKAQNL